MFFIPYGTEEKTKRQSFPYVNVGLVLVNLMMFCLEISALVSGGEAGLEQFVSQFNFVPAVLDQSIVQPTIVTAMFLHAGLRDCS